MDAARDAGLRVAFSLKDVFYHGTARNGLAQITSPAEEERYFKQRVRMMRNHSAMLAYYTNGEFQVTCCLVPTIVMDPTQCVACRRVARVFLLPAALCASAVAGRIGPGSP